MKKTFTLFILFAIAFSIVAQSNPPKREFRAAWIASVSNLDWPKSVSVSAQKSSLISIFDKLQELNFNAVIFQIRPECDALYNSPYEPWSYWLTGSQGTPPSPLYDPLEFAIEEAHKRGMELHAWFNPYRAKHENSNYPLSSIHVVNQHPDWVLDTGSLIILNPGLPEVQQYNTNVIMDVVNRYDVDGVHFDDYFYPYPPDHFSDVDLDWQTFQTYPNGFTNIRDWRRNNVNVQMAMINDSIQIVKPHVKFGISPFGIWKNGVPSGITGMNAYDVIFADPMAWLNEGSVDYLTPQLYWRIGGGQDYSKLMPWWADSVDANGRHLYTGNIFGSYNSNELPRQLTLNRNNPKTLGIVLFRATHLMNNSLSFADSLEDNYFRYKSLLPSMDWKDVIPPNEPLNARFERAAGTGISELKWDLPNTASDGDSASRYVIYRSQNSSIQPSDLDDPENIFDVKGNRTAFLKSGMSQTGEYNFIVTALDRNYNESVMSNAVNIVAPSSPLLAYPADGAVDQPDTILLGWNYAAQSSEYILQIANDFNFSQVVYEQLGLTDTTLVVTGIGGQQTFYWRVQSANPAGTSSFADTRSFTTGFPIEPQLHYPTDVTADIPINFTFNWGSTPLTDSYHLQLSKGADFLPGAVVIDTAGLIDTNLISPTLENNRFYFWRVRSKNALGNSLWSDTFTFKTEILTLVTDDKNIPSEFRLFQNYPNPFNPNTKISFSIPKSGFTTLKIYDLLGREIETLVATELSAGNYTIDFNASGLSSGIYIYSLRNAEKAQNMKMVLVK
jgi:uncharacterized lipoprotein YddW (UPF0748 family)